MPILIALALFGFAILSIAFTLLWECIGAVVEHAGAKEPRSRTRRRSTRYTRGGTSSVCVVNGKVHRITYGREE